jgi:hypothetical protein
VEIAFHSRELNRLNDIIRDTATARLMTDTAKKIAGGNRNDWRLLVSEALSQERDSTGQRSPEGLLDFSFLPEVAAKPLASQTRHFLQGSRFLKQIGCARDHRQMFFRFEFFIKLVD